MNNTENTAFASALINEVKGILYSLPVGTLLLKFDTTRYESLRKEVVTFKIDLGNGREMYINFDRKIEVKS